MSFKREGNDKGLLRNLCHQRVRELLSSHIPQDEAKLLSNGRLSCTICNHRPIFDTINMLSVHRRGKRHLRELSAFIKCKEDAAIKALRKYPLLNENKETLSVKDTCKSRWSQHSRKHILELPKITSPTTLALSIPDQPDRKSNLACVRSYLKTMSRKSSLQKVVDKNRENYGVDLYKVAECDKVSPPQEVIKNCSPTLPIIDKSRIDVQDYEVKLRMSGWIKDYSGKWIKDPNVEFDSDDDEVPAPPT